MKPGFALLLIICAITSCSAQAAKPTTRPEAEYYVFAYSQHYRVPLPLVRAVVERESNWRPCVDFSQRRCRPDATHAPDCSQSACV